MAVRVGKSFKIAPGAKVSVNAKSASVTLGGKGCIALMVPLLALAACGGTAHSASMSRPPAHGTSAPPSGIAAGASPHGTAAASPHGTAAASPHSAAAASSSALSAQTGLSCGTDIDPTGAYLPERGMTAEHLIALLGAMLIVDGKGIIAGTPGQAYVNLLGGAQFNLGMNYSGGQLSADAAKFAEDEQTYNPTGPVQASVGPTLEADIRQLMRDCPQSIKDARTIASR